MRSAQRITMMGNVGTMLVEKEAVKERWAEYCEGLLNVEEDRMAKIVAFGKKSGLKVLERLNNAHITSIVLVIYGPLAGWNLLLVVIGKTAS